MTEKICRNDPCPCGSGRKFKHCCGKKGGSKAPVKKRGGALKWVLLVVLCVGAGYAFRSLGFFSSSPPSPAVNPLALPQTEINRTVTPGAKINTLTGLYDPPPGPVPEGRVWSPDHGHWHYAPRPAADAGGATNPAQPPEGAPYPPPSGPTPEGKVWSPEHGHWHNDLSSKSPAPVEADPVPGTMPGEAVEVVEKGSDPAPKPVDEEPVSIPAARESPP
jgi:hypothetical protein